MLLHLEIGFAFEPDAAFEKPELHGIDNFRLGIEIAIEPSWNKHCVRRPLSTTNSSYSAAEKMPLYLTVEAQGDTQDHTTGITTAATRKKNAASASACECGFDPCKKSFRIDLRLFAVATGLSAVEIAADVTTGPRLPRIGGEPLGDRSSLGGSGAVFERLMQKFFQKVCSIKIRFAG